ncbi:MAG TPA: helix-turn-helix transcriptional regulator [Acidimicrobiales bacterium]|jgi:transcriptional regulator with XRE-family HTH domain
MDDEHDGGGAFGSYVRAQRRVARLSLRQLADLTQISNPYLSQIERGLHQPSVTVIKNLARALGVSVEALLAQAAGLVGHYDTGTEDAINADDRLDDAQKQALLAVYRSMVGDTPPTEAASTGAAGTVRTRTVRVTKASPRKAPAKTAPAKKAAANKVSAKKAPAKKAAATKAPGKKAARKSTGARKRASPAPGGTQGSST